MPRYAPIRWVRSQENRLRQAVASYNRAITMAEKDPAFQARIPAGMRASDVLPPRTTVAEERGKIETAAQLDARVRELGAILKKNDPRALDVVITDKQQVATRYEVKVERNRETQVTRRRLKEAREAGLHPVRKEKTDRRGRPVRDASGRKQYYWTVEGSYERQQLQKKGLALNPTAGGTRGFDPNIERAYFQQKAPKDLTRYYDNYKQALKSTIPSVLDEVGQLMDDFVAYGGNMEDLFYNGGEEFDLDFMYPESNPMAAGSRARAVVSAWKEAVDRVKTA